MCYAKTLSISYISPGDMGQKLPEMDEEMFTKSVLKYYKDKVAGNYSNSGSALLSSFSPWMATFVPDNFEVFFVVSYFLTNSY
jgi:hypothetical protein